MVEQGFPPDPTASQPLPFQVVLKGDSTAATPPWPAAVHQIERESGRKETKKKKIGRGLKLSQEGVCSFNRKREMIYFTWRERGREGESLFPLCFSFTSVYLKVS